MTYTNLEGKRLFEETWNGPYPLLVFCPNCGHASPWSLVSDSAEPVLVLCVLCKTPFSVTSLPVRQDPAKKSD